MGEKEKKKELAIKCATMTALTLQQSNWPLKKKIA